MYELARDVFARTLEEIRAAGTWKEERIIQSPQGAEIEVGGRRVLNFCANNYLGLSSHPEVLAAARAALDERGYGLSSVRFICGTQDLHRELERRLAAFFGFEDAILFSLLLRRQRRASSRRSSASRTPSSPTRSTTRPSSTASACARPSGSLRQRRHGRAGGEARRGGRGAPAARRHRRRLLHGRLPGQARRDLRPRREVPRAGPRRRLPRLRLRGPTGRGTPEHFGVQGGRHHDLHAGQGAGRRRRRLRRRPQEVVDLLRQRARPYLFSNTLAPPIVGATLEVLDLLEAIDRAARPAHGERRGASGRA